MDRTEDRSDLDKAQRRFKGAVVLGGIGFIALSFVYFTPIYGVISRYGIQNDLYTMFPIVGLGAAIYRTRKVSPENRRGWFYITCALSLWFTGALAQALWQNLVDPKVQFPTIADPFYVVAYMFGIAAAMKVSAARSRTYALDGVSIAVALLFILWLPVFAPIVEKYDPWRLSVALIYPVFDVIIISVSVIGFLRGTSSRRRANLFLTAALFSEAVGDLIFTSLGAPSVPPPASQLAEFTTCMLIGLAAMYPERDVLTNSAKESIATLLWPYAPTVVAAIVAVWMLTTRHHFDSAQAGLGVGVVATVMIRQLLALFDNARMAKELEYLAYYDPLTGLGNRRRLRQAIEALARQKAHPIAVILMDLDDFKIVNDTLGHDIGDGLLQVIGERLRGGVRDSDVVVRLGGDEFAILLDNASKDQAKRLAERVQGAFEEPIEVGGYSLAVKMSIGVAPSTSDVAFDALLRHADLAMYNGKRAGKGRLIVFEEFMDDAARQELTLHLAN